MADNFFLGGQIRAFCQGPDGEIARQSKICMSRRPSAVIIGCYKLSVNSTMSALHQASGLGKSSPDVANY